MVLDVPKILFIHGIGGIGGAERELVTIVTQLAQRSYHPIVVCPCPSSLQRELASCGIEARDASFPAWRKWKTRFARGRSIHFLESMIDSVQPQLVHVNDIWWVPQVLRASQRFAVPVVAHVRQEIEPAKVIPYELNKVDYVFTVSRQIERAFAAGGGSPRQVETLYSGLDLNRFSLNVNGDQIRQVLGFSPEDMVLGTVANLFSRKGYDVMLQAMPMIIAKVPRTHYLIIGAGEKTYEEQLHRQVKRLCLEKYVHFLGFQPDVVPYLAALDVYVQPSRLEGLALAVLEAMAVNKPVVATNVGGLSEVVHDQYTGLFVKPDDAQALAQAVLALLADPERCRVLGAQGCQRVKSQFNVGAMMDRLVDVYQDVLRPQ